jgi:LysR family carnitine catabolism transcriptional activator
MDRRHLEYFLAIAESGSFTRAAAILNIAQPSLSHTILMLERELGAQLFERLGRGVKLTSAGQALLGPARRTLGSFQLATSAVRSIADSGFGRLSVITNTLWAIEPLVQIIGEFRQLHPAVQFTCA